MQTPRVEFEQGKKHKPSEPNVMSKPFLIFWLVIIFAWVVMLIYAFWLMIAVARIPSSNVNTNLVLAQTRSTPIPTVAAFPTATPFSTPTGPLGQFNLPTSSPTMTRPPPTPPPGSTVLSLTPSVDTVGWTSSIDGQSHFGDGKIHVGFFRGHVYHGAIQFDLSGIPPDSTIIQATLELTGLSDKNLGLGGVWQVRILDTTLDETWFVLTYDKLRQANVVSTLQPVLPRDNLAQDITHTFHFDETQLAILMERLKTGRISFRIDGPSSGPDNLFTWDDGLSNETEEEQFEQTRQPTLKIVLKESPLVVITSTPTPENILTVAAEFDGTTTPTPLPANWVTPVIVTAIPSPANAATAAYQKQVTTAEAIVYGTATLVPVNVWTATPVPVIIPLPEGVPTSSVPPTPAPSSIPEILVGKIAFLSDRANNSQKPQPSVYVMDANGSNIALLTDQNIYAEAVARDRFAANQAFMAFVREVKQEDGQQRPAIFLYDYLANRAEQVTWFQSGMAYQPAWSPTQTRIAFVSDDSGTEEIWAINHNRSDSQQLTRDDPTRLDGHPSWSPDGSQIVFWSNRTGKQQIWVMNADGSNPRLLHQSNFNDWNPVWIKYTDLIIRPVPGEWHSPDE